jgi:hypothetical protein
MASNSTMIMVLSVMSLATIALTTIAITSLFSKDKELCYIYHVENHKIVLELCRISNNGYVYIVHCNDDMTKVSKPRWNMDPNSKDEESFRQRLVNIIIDPSKKRVTFSKTHS